MTILVVDDHPGVTEVIQALLTKEGYHVLTAKNGEQAQKMWEEFQGPIHLLLTDIVLPGNYCGPAIASKFLFVYPTAQALFMTGYIDAGFLENHGLRPDQEFLQKPLNFPELFEKLSVLLPATRPLTRAAGR